MGQGGAHGVRSAGGSMRSIPSDFSDYRAYPLRARKVEFGGAPEVENVSALNEILFGQKALAAADRHRERGSREARGVEQGRLGVRGAGPERPAGLGR
jgi:hypothetical protein